MTNQWSHEQVPEQQSSPRGRLARLALLMVGLGVSVASWAQIPPAGTLISNTANSTQQVGVVPQASTSNSVSLIVGVPAPALPVLTKNYLAPSIVAGASVSLVFQLINSAGNPSQAGLAFTDTLPNGLRMTAGATSTVSGAGCAASVALTAPSTISVLGGALSAGTATCLITIAGVTNSSPNSLNPDCSNNPAAFTNGAASMSGLANVVNGVNNRCLVVLGIPGKPNLDMALIKSLSANMGTSPSGSYTVRLRYLNVSHMDGRKTDVSIVDALPAGMLFVPGTLRVLPTGGVPAISLANTTGTFMAHGANATYSVTGNTVSVAFSRLEQGEWGLIEFDMTIAPGIAVDTVLPNTAQVSYVDFEGKAAPPKSSNTSEFRVTGTEGVSLRGTTLAAVDPGSTVTFENLLTNNGVRSDTFDISLTGSNYPGGTVFKLYKSDGVTPLADTNGNGIPDTGFVAAGGTYKIIVKAQIPNGSSGGPYSVTKNAQSVTNPLVKASDVDVVSTIGVLCRMVLEPNNSGNLAPGGSIVYTHVLTNIGNCGETVTFPADFLANLSAGWNAQVFVDNPVAGGQSIVGVLDAGDAAVTGTTTLPIPAGGRIVFMTRVSAPANAVNGSVNTTNFRVVGGAGGVLTVSDITTVLNGSIGDISDEITVFIDPGFLRPTVWGFIGKPLYLRAKAPSCNADPAIIERRTVVITGPNGEREEVIATETGPNTGVFVVEPLNIRLPPVKPGDRVLEGRPYDTLDVELIGCGKKISTMVTLIDPNSVVFDSRTNQPIAGATVRLVKASGASCTNTPATVSTAMADLLVPAPNVFVTGSDGRFEFQLVAAGDYCALVTPPNGYTWSSTVPFAQLPPGRNVIASGPTTGGSYGGPFRVGPETGPVIVDIPVDGGLIGGLFVQKTALRSIVEIGEFLDYGVNVKNNTGYALSQSDVLLTDTLPAGFSYAAGTARRDGQRIADPQGGSGPRLVFNLGRMTKDQQIRISYRVRVGPGALQGDGINRVVASYRLSAGSTLYSESNIATAKVTVTGGVFTDRAYVIGKVFADCNKDGVQSAGGKDGQRDVGVPGVRLFLEDGTNVITDAEGKFSFYGLLPRAHMLKLDRTTLPAGVELKDLSKLSSRNFGKGDSRIVDLKNGELHKANFAIGTCTESVLSDISLRRKAAASLKDEFDGRLQQTLETDPNVRALSDIKALPASGIVGVTAPTANIAAPAALGAPIEPSVSPKTTAVPAPRFDSLFRPQSDSTVKPHMERMSKVPEVLLESVLPQEDNSLGFIGLNDADIIAFAQTTVRVKGTAGTTFKLFVNGKEIADDRIGKKAEFADKQSQAWEYRGVNLAVGENTLAVKQFDSFGNARGEKTIKVVAPGALAKLTIEFPQNSKGGAIADGKTPALVVMRLTDANGVPVTSRTAVSLSATAGRWNVEDMSPSEPGVQAFIEGGRAEFELVSPSEPTESFVRAASGDIYAEAKLDFLPDLRDMIAAGVIEGVLNLRKLDSRALMPARAQDGFEQEISHLSRTWGDGKRDAAARAAMFLKGRVKGEYLLTLAYDSDKNTRERLFRDIQPDEFYPVYGDSSVRAFDAQSTGRFYVRVDNKKSYLLYGDYNTSQPSDARKLSNYSRSLTGMKQHFENSGISANVFASRDSTRQIIDEFPANGTSGPFTLSRASGLINSEKIEILTRDRNQPAVILRAQPLARFVDYELEPLTGRILFKAPIASLDENLNPISVRITYEVDQGGQNFWVAGGDVQVKLSDRFEVGAMVVDDRNPMDKFRMAGINAIAKLADKTFLIAELAHTRRESFVNALSQGSKEGNAQRVEFRHTDTRLEANFYAGRADQNFDNQSASLTHGRQEIGGKLAYKLDTKTRIKGELLRTEDLVSGAKRDGLLIAAERTFENGLRVEGGIRHARESQPQQAITGTQMPDHVTAVRARVTGEIPSVKDAVAYAEAEIDVQDSSRKIAAIGADYKLGTNGRLYARHEFISSLTGPYGLNNQQRQNATVIGVNTDYMKDGNVFSEYRIRDAIAGGAAEAALGLRNTWSLVDGLRLQTGFERVYTISGLGDGESTAVTFGLEYTANPLWKGSTRLEVRNGHNSDSILSTVGAASKLNRDWTLLGRNTFSLIKNKGQSTGEREQDRMQVGLAYRDTDTDVWNALGRVEHRNENDSTQEGIALKRTVELISIHANWQPRRPVTFSGRYAAKWANDRTNGLNTKINAQLISARAAIDIAPRWDVSLNLSTLLSQGSKSRQYGIGAELGFMVMENLWVSAGYNFFGYRDDDLAAGDYTNRGVYVRLRYKFDEDLFASGKGKSDKPAGTSAANTADK